MAAFDDSYWAAQDEAAKRRAAMVAALGSPAPPWGPTEPGFPTQTQGGTLAGAHNLLSVGPEDVGKSQGRVAMEQLFGAGMYPVTKMLDLAQWLGTPVVAAPGAAPAAEGLPGGKRKLSPSAYLSGILGGKGGMDQTIAGVPEVPPPAAPGASLPPRINPTEWGQYGPVAPPELAPPNPQPRPTAPDLGPGQELVGKLEHDVPVAPKESNMGHVLAAVLGGLVAGPIGALATLGISKHQSVEAEKEYQAASVQHDTLVAQAKQQLADMQRNYQDTVAQVDWGNLESVRNHENKARDMNWEYANKKNEFETKILEARQNVDLARAQLESQNATRQYQAQLQQWQYNEKNSRPIPLGNGGLAIKQPDGSYRIINQASMRMGMGLGGGASGGAGAKNSVPGVQRQLDLQRAMMQAAQSNDPYLGGMAASYGLTPYAQQIFGDEYPQRMQQIQQQLIQGGMMPGSSDYAQAVDDQLSQQIMQLLMQQGGPEALSAWNPLANDFGAIWQGGWDDGSGAAAP